jgi:hypothetical protein
MEVDYDSKAVFGWEIDTTNEDKFRKVLKEVFNYEKADDFSFWSSEDVEQAEEEILINLMLVGNYYCDEADAYGLLFGKNCEGKQLSEITDWFETNKEMILKIEKIMEEPPKFINEGGGLVRKEYDKII